VDANELSFARTQLGVTDCFADYSEFIEKGEMDGVVLATPSGLHCGQIEIALDAGKHVFTEKPMGITIEECLRAERAKEKQPDKVFMIGFMRRYDTQLRHAKEMIEQGVIGEPYMIKNTDIDPVQTIESVLRFAPTSGGIFVSMGVHGVDIQRWMLGSRPASVYAMGNSYAYPQFADFGDVEVGCATYQYENGAMGILHVGRTAAHGYHIETEIIGTEGSIRVSPIPGKDQIMQYNRQGVLIECVEEFRTRFAEAFLAEMTAFVECIRTGRPADVTVYDGTEATRIVMATRESYQTGQVVPISYN